MQQPFFLCHIVCSVLLFGCIRIPGCSGCFFCPLFFGYFQKSFLQSCLGGFFACFRRFCGAFFCLTGCNVHIAFSLEYRLFVNDNEAGADISDHPRRSGKLRFACTVTSPLISPPMIMESASTSPSILPVEPTIREPATLALPSTTPSILAEPGVENCLPQQHPFLQYW